MSLLIKNGTVVTMNDSRDVIHADILVHNDRIVQIAPAIDEIAEQTIDARDKLVIPGLIQSHIHLCQVLFRGSADDMELLDWLKLRIWPLEGGHDEESLYYSALLGSAECLRAGTTAVIDMGTVHHTESIFSAVQQAGIRYLGGKCMMDFGPEVPASLMDTRDNALQESLDLYSKWNGRENGRINYTFCPRFALSCTEGLLCEVQKLSIEYEIPVHTHASENISEVEAVQRISGMRNITYFHKLNLCNKNLILAHCIHLDDQEMDILTNTDTKIVHCPTANLKLASGIAKIPEMLDKGAQAALGSDGAPCNNNLDIFNEMRLAALIQKPLHGPRSMPAERVFEMATRGGARAMGMEKEIGSLEIGKKADIAIVNLDGWHTQPVNAAGVYSHLVYQAKSSDVCATIVDGKVLMLNDTVKTIDAKEVKAKAGEAFQRVTDRTGLF